ncbi:winged helix-turn-helix domain-containing protein [Sunxiuqinia elliptica]|uniref:Transcriptional regulator n=1 Tax=Sunxiuqinia elliptica TaxID=655355 RepID=A0A1I2J1T7_9BACT|nr:transcriptional regulator [Sunxiuqinia elliptica]TDN98254.1 transcriptional regulator [Sunxiuqinia elliptica]TDO60360.1 transcriptional regulator [Sunxiuqinia elliptica]SFF46916.1 Winged helix DNA-binding domain-containing protein [Sunxiuqinia elliptica]
MKNIFQNLDKAFENKLRLGIMSILSVNASISYNSLKETLEATDGNLASHLKHLEKVGYLSVTKSFINRKPNTEYSITDAGRIAFEKHLSALEAIIKGL